MKNSREFADFIRDKTLGAEPSLLSFDNVSLSIPVDLSIKVAEKRERALP